MPDIDLSRDLDATPDQVWTAITDPAQLARWWWPMWPDTTYDIEARAGSTYRIESRAQGMGVTGEVRESDPPRRLTYTWTWLTDGTPDPGTDTVTLTIEPGTSGSSRLGLHHACSDADSVADLTAGWNAVLDRLVAQFS